MTPLLALRRARRDVGVLVIWILLVAFAAVLAVGLPRLLLTTIDSGARQAVAGAGSNTDVIVTADVSSNQDSEYAPVAPGQIESLAAALPGRLPSALRAVSEGGTLTVIGPATQLSSINGVATIHSAAPPVTVQLGMLTPQNTKALHLVAGALPGSTVANGPVPVVLSQASATAAGLSVGNVAQVSTIPVASAITGGDQLEIRVVGIVAESGADAATQWADTPWLWKPVVPKRSSTSLTDSSPVRITLLTSESGVARAAGEYSTPFKATIHVRLDAQRFTAAREAAVNQELIVLAGHDSRLGGTSGAQLGINSQYGIALADFPAQERAAIAQISVMAAGVLGVAAVVLLLVSRMLVARRESDLALERARGASLPSIAGRALLETVIAEVIGLAIGLVVVQYMYPGPLDEPEFLVLVALVALVAVPVQTVLLVRGAWSGRRVPANRSDRLDAQRRVRARRIAVELTVLALAAAALISLGARGLLETQTNGVDLLLASAPLLLAASVAIIVLRIYRFPLALGIAAGRRSNGALGLLAAVRAARSIAVLPLLALTLAVALAVGGGLLSSTVAAGQNTASWQRIGADVRVNTAATDAQVATIARAPGATGATAFRSEQGIQLRLSSGTDFGTLMAVDPSYADVVGALPTAGASRAGAAALRKLQDSSDSGPLPVVVDSDLASQFTGSDVGMYLGVKFITLRVVGVTDESPSGYLGSPFLFVDRAALAKRLGRAVATNTVLVNGPGAGTAIESLHAPAASIHSRAQWLAQRRGLALVSGVDTTIWLSTLVTALLAILALVVTLLSGARERGRSLALIRTLGLRSCLGGVLALAELGPVLLAALVGGICSAIAIVVALEPAMGLQQLAGGLGNPAPTVSPLLVIALAGSAIVLLLVALLIEMIVRRRDRLSEVLRVGGSI